jgi:hypothetical protein
MKPEANGEDPHFASRVPIRLLAHPPITLGAYGFAS